MIRTSVHTTRDANTAVALAAIVQSSFFWVFGTCLLLACFEVFRRICCVDQALDVFDVEIRLKGGYPWK